MAPADLAFYGGISFLAGTLGASLNFHFGISVVAAVACLLALRIFRGWTVRHCALALALFLVGISYVHLYANLKERRERIPLRQPVSFSAIVIEEPEHYENLQRLSLALQPPFGGTIVALTALFPRFSYGDQLALRGAIAPKESRISRPTTFFPEVKLVDQHRGSPIKETLLNFKETLISQFRKTLPSDSAALLSGLTFGSRTDFSERLKGDMRLSGTTHLVALSGYNIAILAFAIHAIAKRKLARRGTFFLTVGVIVLFVLMVGAQASVVRAAIMGCLVLLAREAGRLYDPRNAITLAALLMVLVHPYLMAYDLGFQLSFLSLLGIVYLRPFLEQSFRITPRPNDFLGWRENALTTAAAQLAVIPVVLSRFGEFSLTAIFSNVLILGLVPLTMFLGFLLALITWALYPLGLLVAFVVNPILWYQQEVIHLFAAWRVPIGVRFLPVISLLYYGALILAIIKKATRHETN